MGAYDTFRDHCPSCEQASYDQTKFREQPDYLCFNVGGLVPDALLHDHTIELNPCAYCGGELYAVLRGGIFRGYAAYPVEPVLYSDRGRREEIRDYVQNLVKQLKGNTTVIGRVLSQITNAQGENND